jgi:hypothetical protein
MMMDTGILTGGTGAGKTPFGNGVAPAVVRPARGRLFALVDLLDRLEQEKGAGRLAAVLSILSTRRAGCRDDDAVAADLLGGGAGGKR